MIRSALLALLLLLPLGVAQAADDIPAARVVLPWADFKVLYEKGKAPEVKPEPSPRAFAVAKAVYTGEVQGESTVFKARIRVNVLKEKGWATVPLLPTSVALRQARVGAADAAIYLENGWYTFITDKSGPVDIDLEFAVSTWESAGQSGFTFALAPSGGTEVDLVVPAEQQLEFKVSNAQQVVSTAAGNTRKMHALLPATGNLAVTWQRKGASAQDTGPEATARVYAEHQALIGVGEGILQGTSIINYSILHKGVQSLRFSLPADVTVLDVTGKGVADWKATEANGRRNIEVSLGFEAKGAYTLRVDYERGLKEGSTSVEVPQLALAGVERIKGWVGVDARSNLEITAGTVAEARAVDVRELPASILGQTDWPVLLGFAYRKEGWNIPLVVRQHTDLDMIVTLIDQAAATTALTPDGRRMTQVTYAMRNNRAQYLRLKLPKGAQPWSTFVGGRAVKPAQGDDGRILIPLARSQTAGGDLARFAVEIVYVEEGNPPSGGRTSDFEAELPIADVPSTAVDWTVYVPKGAKIKPRTIGGALRPVPYFTPIDLGGVALDQLKNQVQQQANAQFDSGAMGAGVQPVRVSLPLDGQAYNFEKLLVLNEKLDLHFTYKGPK
jgi:hypothetical protein